MLTGAAAALAALFVGLSAARELRGSPLIATVAIGLSLVTANLLARPHVLALPLAAAWGKLLSQTSAERLQRAWELEKAFEARQQRLATIKSDDIQP